MPIVCITEKWENKSETMVEFQKLAMDIADYVPERKEVNTPTEQAAALTAEQGGIIAVSMVFGRPGVKAISVNNVFPDPQSISSGAYLIARPLLLVAKGALRGEVKRFFEFILSPQGQKIVARNFIPVRHELVNK